VADDTVAIQSAVNACPSGGTVVGKSRTYKVGSISLKSNLTFADFNLVTRVSSADFDSPVTIGRYYDTTLRKSITIKNVHINGNRGAQSTISRYEDGGRQGFRIIGNVDDILISGCSATYCATDGIILYSGPGTRSSSTTANVPLLRNVRVENSTFNWNRRHGGSGDSLGNLTFVNCQFDNNGRDVSGAQIGAKGATSNGYRYGNGFDMERYDVGGTVSSATFQGCQARGNIKTGLLFYDPVYQYATNWVPNQIIKMLGCTMDYGVENRDSTAALEITGLPTYKTGPSVYRDITIDGCTIYGVMTLRCVSGAKISNTVVNNSYGSAGVLDYARDVYVSNLGGRRFYSYQSTVTYA
jgi:hypothetical protein